MQTVVLLLYKGRSISRVVGWAAWGKSGYFQFCEDEHTGELFPNLIICHHIASVWTNGISRLVSRIEECSLLNREACLAQRKLYEESGLNNYKDGEIFNQRSLNLSIF